MFYNYNLVIIKQKINNKLFYKFQDKLMMSIQVDSYQSDIWSPIRIGDQMNGLKKLKVSICSAYSVIQIRLDHWP